jgi:hypothetical protein
MSTAFFPLGMESYNNSRFGQYSSWKGSGTYSNPSAITSGNIRPLTNKDYTNDVYVKYGLPRPIKGIYRKGTTNINSDDPAYLNRAIKSSTGGSLVGQLIDRPGEFSVKQNTTTEISETDKLNSDCTTCNGIGLVADYYPEPYLTENPEPVTTSSQLCCNAQKKALRRVRPASTILKKNYYTRHEEYMQNRCQTYEQKSFNFYTDQTSVVDETTYSLTNEYRANCFPNTGLTGYTQPELVLKAFLFINAGGALSSSDVTSFYNQQNDIITLPLFVDYLSSLSSDSNQDLAFFIFNNLVTNPYFGFTNGSVNVNACKKVIYKPSNPQFAVQGGVSSATRTLKLGLTTIEKNVANINMLKGYNSIDNIQQVPLVYKNKSVRCNAGLPFYYQDHSRNPKTCFKNSNDVSVKTEYYNSYALSLGNGVGITIPN